MRGIVWICLESKVVHRVNLSYDFKRLWLKAQYAFLDLWETTYGAD